MTKVVKIRLGRSGQFALVDWDDYSEVIGYKWVLTKRGGGLVYAVRIAKINGKARVVYMHREILGLTDSKQIVDHKDRNGLNNTRENLRICTRAQNMANRASMKSSSSKYLGVCFEKHTKKWRAVISHNDRQTPLGRFSNEIDAALAYNEAAKKVHGEFARLNVVEENFLPTQTK